jgi:chromosome segregation ATPase
VQSARKSVEELTAQVAELRKKVSEGAKKASGATKKTAGLTKQLANATRQLEEAEKAAFEAIEELQQANSAAADLRKQLHLERALHRSTRERLSEVEVKNTELRHKNAILKGLLEHHNIEYTC